MTTKRKTGGTRSAESAHDDLVEPFLSNMNTPANREATKEHSFPMDVEKIKVHTENDQVLEAVVTSKKADAIWILLGEGPHSVKCKLVPTRNSLAYVGSLMGRELIYQRSVKQVQADMARHNQEPYIRVKR